MKYFTLLFVILIAPVSVHAEEVSFLIETTFASSNVEPTPTVLPTGRAGREYIKRLNEANSSQAAEIVEETAPSAPVPIVNPEPVPVQSSSAAASVVPVAPVVEQEEPVEDVAPTPPPTTYTAKEQEELDELTLEQLEEYADEATANFEEQLEQLEEGFTISGTSINESPLSPTQRAAILRRSIRTVGQLKIFTKALSESDENIRQVTLGDEKIEISYRQKAKLFGLIPMNYLLKTTVEDGEVAVKQPWWHFLARDDVKTYKEELQNQLDLLGDIDPEDPDLEAKLQKQQQTLQTISNVSKMLHDTGMAIIRKIGG